MISADDIDERGNIIIKIKDDEEESDDDLPDYDYEDEYHMP